MRFVCCFGLNPSIERVSLKKKSTAQSLSSEYGKLARNLHHRFGRQLWSPLLPVFDIEVPEIFEPISKPPWWSSLRWRPLKKVQPLSWDGFSWGVLLSLGCQDIAQSNHPSVQGYYNRLVELVIHMKKVDGWTAFSQRQEVKVESGCWVTPWKFNSSPLKTGHPKSKVIFQPSFLGGYVKLRGGTKKSVLEGLFGFRKLHLGEIWAKISTCWAPLVKQKREEVRNRIVWTPIIHSWSLAMLVPQDWFEWMMEHDDSCTDEAKFDFSLTWCFFPFLLHRQLMAGCFFQWFLYDLNPFCQILVIKKAKSLKKNTPWNQPVFGMFFF